MWVDTSVLYIDHLPEVSLNAGTDWVALCGIILTAIIVILGSWVTVRNFKIATEAQKNIAADNLKQSREQGKAEAVAQNRQEWINNLRSAISSFVASCLEIYLVDMSKASAESMSLFAEHQDNIIRQNISDLTLRRTMAKCEAVRWKSQIELYINPNEKESSEMVALAGELLKCADTLEGMDIYNLTQTLINMSQNILKKEWERVKKMD